VIDANNTARFGKDAMVAIFTHDDSGQQMQSLAYSNDQGRTWTKYAGNPVVDTPRNIRNFRDPKVFWYDGGDGAGHWVMLVAAGNVILFYTSPDLKNWEATSGFGPGYGATEGVWETPDLFELPVDGGPEEGDSEQRWVLAVAVQAGAPAGGSGTQYFVGEFDGKTFTSNNPKDAVLWADYGADFYAAQAWNDAPNSRHVWAAWMNNWEYANAVPASTSRGSLTLPRELSLANTPDGLRLRQAPITELQSLRAEPMQWQNVVITSQPNVLEGVSGELLEIKAEFAVTPGMDTDRLGLRMRSDETGDTYTTVGYAVKNNTLFIDRMQSGEVDFNGAFPGVHTAELRPIDGVIRLHIFVDRTSIEVFANDGLVVMTNLIFPDSANTKIELFADGGEARVNSLEIFKLRAATASMAPESE
jgi:sucrose-6-phosphate hydrolase SacC (GH32 family)